TVQYGVLPDPFDPPGPTDAQFEERFIPGKKDFYLTITPTFDRGSYKYYSNDHSFEVWSRLKGSGQTFVKQTLQFGDTIVNHEPGLHEFRVLGRSYLGTVSNLATAPTYEFEVTNPLTAPKDVDWIKINKRE